MGAWVGNATIQKQLERTTVTLDASRQINPSGFGLLLETDRIAVTIEQKLPEETSSALFTGQAIAFFSGHGPGSVTSFPKQRGSPG